VIAGRARTNLLINYYDYVGDVGIDVEYVGCAHLRGRLNVRDFPRLYALLTATGVSLIIKYIKYAL